MNNINKHADASQVSINLTGNQSYTFLTIADNGKGFEPGEARQNNNGHYGLSIMRKRAEEIGGRLTVESTPGQGTQLTARFPNRA